MAMKSIPGRPVVIDQDEAEKIGVAILSWITAQPEMMSRFLAMTGIEPGHIRQVARESGFLGGVTGFIMNHEPTLMEFCRENEIAVEKVQAAHRLLAGPDEGIWL